MILNLFTTDYDEREQYSRSIIKIFYNRKQICGENQIKMVINYALPKSISLKCIYKNVQNRTMKFPNIKTKMYRRKYTGYRPSGIPDLCTRKGIK